MRIFFDLFRNPTLTVAVEAELRAAQLELLVAEGQMDRAKCMLAYHRAVVVRLERRAAQIRHTASIPTPGTPVVSPRLPSTHGGASVPDPGQTPPEVNGTVILTDAALRMMRGMQNTLGSRTPTGVSEPQVQDFPPIDKGAK